jgi:RNA-directed DNA polymerase
MRKNREQQKKGMGRQLSLFDNPIKPDKSHDGGTGSEICTGVELLSQLESQRTLTENLLEAVVDYGNLRNAYQRVRQNKGSAGIDKMDVEALGKWLNKNLITFRETVLAENYQPVPVRKVMIRKPDGGERMLGIPTAKDRMLQQAIHQTLSRYYDPLFSENSFGFRPGRNAHQAILQASKYISSGKEWVVDIDLEKFFDNVNHDRLMQRLSKGIGDKRLLRLIKSYLKSGIMSDGLTEQRIAGTPQGSPLSPLLSNIVLDEWDKEMEKRGHDFCRYADDCNIYVKSKKQENGC